MNCTACSPEPVYKLIGCFFQKQLLNQQYELESDVKSSSVKSLALVFPLHEYIHITFCQRSVRTLQTKCQFFSWFFYTKLFKDQNDSTNHQKCNKRLYERLTIDETHDCYSWTKPAGCLWWWILCWLNIERNVSQCQREVKVDQVTSEWHHTVELNLKSLSSCFQNRHRQTACRRNPSSVASGECV